MALGDISILRECSFGGIGARRHVVASGTTASIKAGELVLKTPGDPAVVVWTASNSAKPVVGTDYLAGLSASTSTETASAAGEVYVYPLVPGVVYLGNPLTPLDCDTQTEYDALVGNCVRLNTTSGGVQTVIDADTHGATYGLIIEPLDLARYPGKIAFSVKLACSYTEQRS